MVLGPSSQHVTILVELAKTVVCAATGRERTPPFAILKVAVVTRCSCTGDEQGGRKRGKEERVLHLDSYAAKWSWLG